VKKKANNCKEKGDCLKKSEHSLGYFYDFLFVANLFYKPTSTIL